MSPTSNLARGLTRGLTGLALGLLLAAFQAAENPLAPPDTALRRRSASIVDTKVPRRTDGVDATSQEALLRPELTFLRTKRPLQLATLAKALTDDAAERAAVTTLLEQGAAAVRAELAAEGAEHDLGAATTLAVSELWQLARDRTVMERHLDTLHAQVVAALVAPEVGELPNMAKQRHWEHVVGVTVFVRAYFEQATDDEARAAARALSGAAFEALFGVGADTVDITGRGLVTRKLALRPGGSGAKEAAVVAPGVGRGVSALEYTAPPGFTREDAAWATIFRATSPDRLDDGKPDPGSDSQHALSIFVLPARPLTKDLHTTFDLVWREQLDTFELGDTVVHYRARLRSGLVSNYMGNFFKRTGAPEHEGAPRTYAVVHVVDLGGGKVQPIIGVAVPNDPGLGMNMFKEGAARVALAWPFAALLDSVVPANGAAAPNPAGGVFQPSDLIGDWETSSSAFGGFYVNAHTGAGAGAAVHSSGGHFYLRPDGTYEYAFAYATSHPQFGNSGGSTSHKGRYTLNGDVPVLQPERPIGYDFEYCAVGIGTRRMEDGVHRVLVLVGSNSEDQFLSPYCVPEWDGYQGTMDWYVEKQPRE